MFPKVLAIVVLLAVAYCQEHSHYKYQTILKHEEPKKIEHHSVHIPIHTYHAAPSHEYHSGGQSHGHAVSSQSIIRHDSGHQEQSHENSHHYIVPVQHHEPAPVHEIISIKAAPSIEIHSGGQSHGHAISSQSIVRHESGHHEQSHGDSHYVVAAPVHQTVSLHSAPIHGIQSSEQSHGHAVSSQSIIRHDSGHKEQSSGDGHYFIPVEHHSAPIHTVSLHAAPSHEIQSESHGHAISSQNIIRHDDHNSNEGSEHYIIPVQHHAAPVRHTVIQAAPIQQHYIQESGHKEQSKHYEESHHEDYYAHPKYEFEYKVEDPHTKDSKYQHESRDGDTVKGVYSLHDADGSIRTVEYSADKHTGFNALVHNSAPSKHEQQSHHH